MHVGLSRLARSLPVSAIALAAICNSGCTLPQVKPRMSTDFASGATRVRTVAVLPIDLSVQIAGQSTRSMQTVELDRAMLDRVHRGLGAALGRRGYQVTALLEPNGASVDPRNGKWHLVIHPKDLAALRVHIHQTTSPYAAGPGFIETRVSADLTRYLGQSSGADASLYARGWAYVAPEEGGGATALKVIFGVLLVLVIVGVFVALAAGKGRGGSGLGKFLGGAGRVMAQTAALAGQVMIRTAPYVIVGATQARWHDDPIHCYSCPPPPPPPPPPPSPVEPESPEPFEGNSVEAPLPAPPRPPPPPAASPAQLQEQPPVLHLRQGPLPTGHEVGLAVSLIHNQSGRVLWHAGQRFAVKPRVDGNVEDLVEHFLKGLPPAR